MPAKAATKSIFDIEVKNSEIEIKDPTTKKGMGLIFELKPWNCPEVRALDREYAKKVRQAHARGDSEEAERLVEECSTEKLAECVVGWNWDNARFGKIKLDAIEFTRANVVKVLTEEKLSFIRRQVDVKLGQEGDFFDV